jgi:hypothetical protein
MLLVVAGGTAAAQQAALPSPALPPPVLSTVPSPAAGVMPQPSQMSGLPLQVGDLPPGVVVVRVIRQTFQNNVAGQPVLLRVGTTGRVLGAVTEQDGRARFEGIAVGEQVQVRTAVGAETLESQRFEIPAQAGVRMVLAAGVAAGTSAPAPWPAPTASGTASTPTTMSSAVAPSLDDEKSTGSSWRRAGVVTGLMLIGGSVLAWLSLPREGRRSAPDGQPAHVAIVAPPPFEALPADAPRPDLGRLRSRRTDLFEELVRVEKAHAAGRVSDDMRRERHEALVTELALLDGQIEHSRSQ